MKRKRVKIQPISNELQSILSVYDRVEDERVKSVLRRALNESRVFASRADEEEWRRVWTDEGELKPSDCDITFSVIKPERKYRTLDDYDEMSEIEQESSGSYIDDRIIRRDECGAYSSLAGVDAERD